MQKSPFFIGIPTESSLDRLAESLGLGDLVNECNKMSVSKYVTENEIKEFLDNLKLEDYAKEHKEIRESVLAFMLKNPPGEDCVVQLGVHGQPPKDVTDNQQVFSFVIKYECPRLIPLLGNQLKQERIGNHDIRGMYDRDSKQYMVYIHLNRFKNEEKEEPVMKPEKKRSPTPAALVWDKLNRAGLTNEAVLFIVKSLYGTLGLKTPTDERQVMIIERKDSFEIIYSHNDNVVVCCPGADFSVTLADGTVVDGNSGIESAYYVVGKKKELTEDGLLKKHVGSFKLTLSTPKGHAELPYNLSIEDRGEGGIKLTLLCNLEFYFKDGEFHNLEGPAYTAFDGRKNYIVNGKPVSEEEFKQLTNRCS